MNKRKWGYKMRYNYRGFFDVLTDYAKYDAVEFDTKVWWCKRPTKGRSPADRANSAVWVPLQDPIATALKSSGGDLPFGTEVTYTEILPQETVTVAATGSSSALSANLAGLVPIEIGKKYRVMFDGVAYVCVAYKHASWGAICLGNGRLNGGSTEKTDEPFCINVWASTAASISLVTEGTHTVSVDEIVETHTPIQPEYLTGSELTESDNGKLLGVVDGAVGLVDAPNYIGATFQSEDGGNTFTCTETLENIQAGIARGTLPILMVLNNGKITCMFCVCYYPVTDDAGTLMGFCFCYTDVVNEIKYALAYGIDGTITNQIG